MDKDIWGGWSAEPAGGDMAAELLAGVAGLGVVALAVLFLLDLALGWHLGS
jgi:hypothetical protein